MPPIVPRSAGWARPLVFAGLAGAFVLLVAMVREYAFLTDDAFIAFRYARNLADGHGLVFNPGHEPVEGFTGPLWVLVLALIDRIGLAPERSAHLLSISATLLLWAVTVRFCARRPEASRTPWLVLFPAFGLAANRTFAVWATGGLETRWFECLAVLGLLRLVEEEERAARGGRGARLAPVWLALACLTRPEGALVAGMAWVATAAWRRHAGRLEWRALAREWWPCAAALAALFVFRRIYFHEWLPNTWYAKVGGEQFWGSGARYLAAFALEYAVILWLPLLAAATLSWRPVRPGLPRDAGATPPVGPTGFLVAVTAAVLIPHLAYVAAVGGDHFEYRPLGLEIVLGFVLLHEGAIAVAARAGRRRASGSGAMARVALGAYAALVVFASTVIPRASHRQFPADYRTGFPGAQVESLEGGAFLDPDRDPVTRLPGISTLAGWHRDLTRELTARLVAIRQEEHDRFLGPMVEEGRELRALVERGVLPRDLHVAIDCVGALPYHASIRTLDRLGLTDARVARSPRAGTLMGHWRFASFEQAREAGVDLWADDRVHLIVGLDSRPLMRAYNGRDDGEPRVVADLGNDRFLLARLPLGLEAARRRMPALRFESFADTAFAGRYLVRLAAAWSESLEVRPNQPLLASRLARLRAALGDYPGAIGLLRGLIAGGFDPPAVWERLAEYQAAAGRIDSARVTIQQALVTAERQGDAELAARWRQRAHRPDSTWRAGVPEPSLDEE